MGILKDILKAPTLAWSYRREGKILRHHRTYPVEPASKV
jgi:hypothetical protein